MFKFTTFAIVCLVLHTIAGVPLKKDAYEEYKYNKFGLGTLDADRIEGEAKQFYNDYVDAYPFSESDRVEDHRFKSEINGPEADRVMDDGESNQEKGEKTKKNSMEHDEQPEPTFGICLEEDRVIGNDKEGKEDMVDVEEHKEHQKESSQTSSSLEAGRVKGERDDRKEDREKTKVGDKEHHVQNSVIKTDKVMGELKASEENKDLKGKEPKADNLGLRANRVQRIGQKKKMISRSESEQHEKENLSSLEAGRLMGDNKADAKHIQEDNKEQQTKSNSKNQDLEADKVMEENNKRKEDKEKANTDDKPANKKHDTGLKADRLMEDGRERDGKEGTKENEKDQKKKTRLSLEADRVKVGDKKNNKENKESKESKEEKNPNKMGSLGLEASRLSRENTKSKKDKKGSKVTEKKQNKESHYVNLGLEEDRVTGTNEEIKDHEKDSKESESVYHKEPGPKGLDLEEKNLLAKDDEDKVEKFPGSNDKKLADGSNPSYLSSKENKFMMADNKNGDEGSNIEMGKDEGKNQGHLKGDHRGELEAAKVLLDSNKATKKERDQEDNGNMKINRMAEKNESNDNKEMRYSKGSNDNKDEEMADHKEMPLLKVTEKKAVEKNDKEEKFPAANDKKQTDGSNPSDLSLKENKLMMVDSKNGEAGSNIEMDKDEDKNKVDHKIELDAARVLLDSDESTKDEKDRKYPGNTKANRMAEQNGSNNKKEIGHLKGNNNSKDEKKADHKQMPLLKVTAKK